MDLVMLIKKSSTCLATSCLPLSLLNSKTSSKEQPSLLTLTVETWPLETLSSSLLDKSLKNSFCGTSMKPQISDSTLLLSEVPSWLQVQPSTKDLVSSLDKSLPCHGNKKATASRTTGSSSRDACQTVLETRSHELLDVLMEKEKVSLTNLSILASLPVPPHGMLLV
jgi:hypothetical protein